MAATLKRSPAATRQLAARARAHVRIDQPRYEIPREDGEALTRAFMFADASVAGEIHQVGTRLITMISRAMTGSPDHSQATEEEAAIVRVISDVWLAALVGWVTGRTSAEDVEKQIDVAVGLLLR